MSLLKPILLTAFMLGIATTACGFEVSGSWKNSLFLLRETPGQSATDGYLLVDSLRLDLTQPAGSMQFEASCDNRLIYANPEIMTSLPAANPNRVVNLEKSWDGDSRFNDLLQIDRLAVHDRRDTIDWSLGRQAIGFGRIALVSPLDVIAPFAPDALDTDVRPGVDSIRFLRYFDLGGHLGATAVFGRNRELNSYLLTGSDHRFGLDLLGMAGWLRGRPMIGLGLAGDLGGLGLKGEVVTYRGKDVKMDSGDLYDHFTVAAIEAWYRFDNGLTTLLEYLYNGPGSDDPADYLRVAASAPLREGLSYLLGRHYLLLTTSYQAHPLATLQGLVIWNLEDDSFLLRPLLDYSLGDNLSMQLFWSFTIGDAPEPSPIPGFPSAWQSEFGSYADSGGIFVRYYF
ncbi:MAG: hypothetical protein C0616_03250 [Desulfuromonas sp.]|nr:MAG: hypothetical protein C0616_03250 [Desulfuromonas sp.]